MKRRTPSRTGTNRRERGDAGFTLLELLVTIVVLGILSSTVVLALQSVRSSAASAACQSDFATTAVALNAYPPRWVGIQTASEAAVRMW